MEPTMLVQPDTIDFTDWFLTILSVNDYDQVWLDPPHCQGTICVQYVRGDSSSARWIEVVGPGGTLPRKPVPADATGVVCFDYTISGDTTACIIEASVWDAQTGGAIVTQADPRQYVDFLCGGMGMAPAGGPAAWKTEVAEAARKEAGDAIAPGIYRGRFKQFDKLFVAHARVLIQGEPTQGPKARPKGGAKKGRPVARPLKLAYDLPAAASWHKIGNKYQPFWTFCADRPLDAGKGYRTIMRPILLRSDGFVEQMTTHSL
jgi:hypothetical protein